MVQAWWDDEWYAPPHGHVNAAPEIYGNMMEYAFLEVYLPLLDLQFWPLSIINHPTLAACLLDTARGLPSKLRWQMLFGLPLTATKQTSLDQRS